MDCAVISFPRSPSGSGLRPKSQTSALHFVPQTSVEPSSRVRNIPYETKSGALRLSGERGMDCTVISFPRSPSGSGLRPKSQPSALHFVPQTSVDPSSRVRSIPYEKIWSPQGAPYFFRRERDSNPRSCDRLRISRPAQSTTLASLRGSHNVEKKHPFVYPPNKNPLIPFFYFYIWPQIQ